MKGCARNHTPWAAPAGNVVLFQLTGDATMITVRALSITYTGAAARAIIESQFHACAGRVSLMRPSLGCVVLRPGMLQ